MAYVLISADRVLAAVEAARDALGPTPNQIRSAWGREEGMLDDIFSAATWTQKDPLAIKQIALSTQERQLLEPYMKR